MAANQKLVRRCHERLIELAKKGERTTYGELAKFLHAEDEPPSQYLNPIYDGEIEAGRPDITLIPHYASSCFGKYNSRRGPAQSIVFDKNNPAHVRAYKNDLKRVFMHYQGQLKGPWKDWLESAGDR